MRAGRPSTTALRVAALRAAAAGDPVLRRLLADPEEPYSAWCVQASSLAARLQLATWRFAPTRRLIFRMSESLLPGFAVHLLLRKRYVEDTLRAALAPDPRRGAPPAQVVILGAGFDPLALRLARELPEVRFFELDHPATQAVKQRALARHQSAHERIRLLPVDFATESAEERLRAAPGFRAGERTFFLAEGVLMYLAQAEVDALFGLVRRLSAPGSSFLFTALDAALLSDPASPLAHSAGMLARMGEPVRSSLERKSLEGYVRKHGFRLRELADHRTLASRYLEPLKLRRPVFAGELLVLAETLGPARPRG